MERQCELKPARAWHTNRQAHIGLKFTFTDQSLSLNFWNGVKWSRWRFERHRAGVLSLNCFIRVYSHREGFLIVSRTIGATANSTGIVALSGHFASVISLTRPYALERVCLSTRCTNVTSKEMGLSCSSAYILDLDRLMLLSLFQSGSSALEHHWLRNWEFQCGDILVPLCNSRVAAQNGSLTERLRTCLRHTQLNMSLRHGTRLAITGWFILCTIKKRILHTNCIYFF